MLDPIDFEPFRDFAAQRQRLARRAFEVFSQKLSAILRARRAEPERIEHLLDNLLGFCFDDDILLLFKKLCRYYLPIDPQATADYVRAYRDMWDEDSAGFYVGGAEIH